MSHFRLFLNSPLSLTCMTSRQRHRSSGVLCSYGADDLHKVLLYRYGTCTDVQAVVLDIYEACIVFVEYAPQASEGIPGAAGADPTIQG
jgi:hypothetical protein